MPHALRRSAATLAGSLVLATGLQLVAPSAEGATVTNGRPTAPGGVALTWSPAYMTDSHAFTAADATAMATKYDLVAAMPVAFQKYSAQMRETNPKLSLLAYSNATLASPTEASGLPEAAYAHDAAGKRITAPSFGTYLMESSNASWRTAANAMCDDRSARGGYDGCLVDMLTLGIFSAGYVTGLPINPATGVAYTQPEYATQMTKLAAVYRAKSPGLVHIGNSVENSYRYWENKIVTSQALANSQPGAQMEDFLRGASTPVTKFPASAADWVRNVDVIRDMESKGTTGLFTTKLWTTATSAEVAQWQAYSMATFLMGANGHSYFSFTRTRDRAGVLGTNVPYAMPKTIGLPSGAMVAQANGAYTRSFDNGLAVVNPSTATVTVALPSSMKTLDGRTVTSVTLAPNSGEVLVKAATTPPPTTPPTTPTDTTGPTVTLGTATGTGGTLALSGSVTDNVAGGLAVAVAVRNEATGRWRRADGTWGAYSELAATVAAPGGTSSGWSKSFSLPAGSYGVSVVATDAAGNRSPSKPWKVVTVS